MLIQISKDLFVNTEQVNYIKRFTDIVDKKEKIYINFINKDSVTVSMSFEEFLNVVKENYL